MYCLFLESAFWLAVILTAWCAVSALTGWAFSRAARNLNRHLAPPSRWEP